MAYRFSGYLGPYVQIGPGSYQLAPIPVIGSDQWVSVGASIFGSRNGPFAHVIKINEQLGQDPENAPGGARWTAAAFRPFKVRTEAVAAAFDTAIAGMDASIEAEFSALRSESPSPGNSKEEQLSAELTAYRTLSAQKKTYLESQQAIANSFYGSDPANKKFDDFINKVLNGKEGRILFEEVFHEWNTSYTAAHEARTLEAALSRLAPKTAALEVALQSEIATREAAAEADRIATEAAKAEAERIAAEAARAEAERVAAEAADRAIREAHTFRLSDAHAVQFAAAAGVITGSLADGLNIEAIIRSGTQRLIAAGEAILGRATAVGFGALVYSPELGNGDLYPQTVLGMPANMLLPAVPPNLNEIAIAGGTVDLPYRIYGDRKRYALVSTPAQGSMPTKVPVRALTLDSANQSYTFTSSQTPPITLSFPIVPPGNSSTASPVHPGKLPVYTGVTVKPLDVQPETLPAIDFPDFRDCIYCFPIESGLPPIYIVFNSPYKGADTRGKYSGRLFNPDEAGGPILDLDWVSTSITQSGINSIKLHIGRFEASDANSIMVERLEKIIDGELEVSDIDKRFYTHELRELERFRALGIADGVRPDDGGAIWNNTHAATLEDFKLQDSDELLYTIEALEADHQQMIKEFL